jgi:RluA family pseudouridine synthase
MKRKAAIRIGPQEAGTAVLAFLTERFTYHTPTEWQAMIDACRLVRNGQPTRAASLLDAGDILEYLVPERPEPPVDTKFSVVYEDSHLLVINKPGNLPCHPAGRYFQNTLWSLLKKQRHLPYLSFVNRLDRETSGLVLIATTPEAARRCRRQFDSGTVYKRYVALVEGDFPAGEIHARGYLANDPRSAVRKKWRFYPRDAQADLPSAAKTCSTIFRKVEGGKELSKVAAIPQTGRSHQLRASLCSLRYPVVGDKIYGVDETIFLRFISDTLTPSDRQRLRLPRQALHSAELHVRHPRTRQSLQFKAPLPRDMQELPGA